MKKVRVTYHIWVGEYDPTEFSDNHDVRNLGGANLEVTEIGQLSNDGVVVFADDQEVDLPDLLDVYGFWKFEILG